MNVRTPAPGTTAPASSRQQQKQRTRQALLDSALEQLEDKSFSSLSLREVARGAGVVPTAFYRHFESTEQLGLALIDESFRTLRETIRSVRSDTSPEHIIRRSVEIVVRHVHEHRQHFRFIARERSSGVPVLRQAIRTEIRVITSELATDLSRFPYLNAWSTEDLHVIAALFVNAMVSIAEGIIDAPLDTPEADAEVKRIAEKQLRLIVLGVPQWKSET